VRVPMGTQRILEKNSQIFKEEPWNT